MHPQFPTSPPGRAPTPEPSGDALRGSASLRDAVHRAQRSFLVVNAVPLVGGIFLSSFTDIPGEPIYGRLTLGIIWGILQCFLFVATAWVYENRSSRWCDPIEQSLNSIIPDGERSGDYSGQGSRQVNW